MRHRLLSLVCVAAFSVAGLSGAHAQTALELLDRTQKDLQTHYDVAKAEATKKAEEARKAREVKRAEEAKKADETNKGDEPKKELASRRELMEEQFDDAMPFRQEDMVYRNGLNTLEQTRQYLESGNDDSAMQQLASGRSGTDLPEEIRTALDTIRQKLMTERTAREKDYAAEIDAACERAGDAVLKAKEPKDLDGTLKELVKLTRQPDYNRYRGNGEGSSAVRLQAASNFVSRWQDYLLARNRNDDRAVTNTLRNLSDNSNQPLLIPRSVILALQPREPENDSPRSTPRPVQRPQEQIDADAAGIVEAVKTLGEIPDALAKLAKLRQEITSRSSYSYSSDSVLGSSVAGLESIQRAYLEIQHGLATTISLGISRTENTSHPNIENALLPLRVQLVKLVAPRLLGATEEDKAADGEGLDAYLHRLIEAAKKRQDWSAVERGLDLKRTLAASASSAFVNSNDQETQAFKNFFAGRNLEQARQYEQAVISYLTALRSGQEDLPAALIGERLEAIQMAHPTEYASGSKYVLEPPRTPFGYGPPGMYRGMSDPRFPGRMGAQPEPAENTLPVPAVSPSATPGPKPAPSAGPQP